jgi:hypothetical protein
MRPIGDAALRSQSVAKVPFAESPWEVELSFGYGWQIESVRILSARYASAQAFGRFPGSMGACQIPRRARRSFTTAAPRKSLVPTSHISH